MNSSIDLTHQILVASPYIATLVLPLVALGVQTALEWRKQFLQQMAMDTVKWNTVLPKAEPPIYARPSRFIIR